MTNELISPQTHNEAALCSLIALRGMTRGLNKRNPARARELLTQLQTDIELVKNLIIEERKLAGEQCKPA
jgi:hypothetical protein